MNNNQSLHLSSQQLEPKQKPSTSFEATTIMQVEKRSSSKMFWNKRVITLKEGLLSYYSKVPKQMGDLSKLAPKTSVFVENILYIGPPEKAKKANLVEITFMAKDAVKPSTKQSVNQSVNSSYGKDLMAAQQPIVITKKKEIIIWELAFQKAEQMHDLMKAVEKARHPEPIILPEEVVQQPQQQPQFEISKAEQDMLKRESEAQLQEQIRLKEELQKQKAIAEREAKLREEKENQLEIEKQQLIQQLEDQKNSDKMRKHKSKEENAKRQQLKDQINTAWNYNYLQSIELAHVRDPQTIEETVTNSRVMHQSIACMNAHAIKVCKIIIEELCLPNQLKRIKPTTSVHEDRLFSKVTEKSFQHHQEETIDFGEDFYVFDGLIIKLAYSQLKTIKVSVQQDQKDVEKSLQIYDESAIKALGNEFRYLSLLAEAIEMQLQEDPNFPLRVPLCCVVDFKGIRAFVLAVPPTNDQTIVQGPTLSGQYLNNNAIQQYMTTLSKCLNVKPHKMFYDNELIATNIPLSLFVEVHNIAKEEYLEMRWVENSENAADFPPQNLNVYYLGKCADLMPMHVDDMRDLIPTNRLRPEYVRSLQKPLNADSFLSRIPTQDSEVDDLNVSQAGLQLKDMVKYLVAKFDSLDFLPTDSLSLTDCFHKEGINMRMLGFVCNSTTLQHIRELCICEMIARVCKKVLRNNLADLLRNFKQQLTAKFMSQSTSQMLEYSLLQDMTSEDYKDINKILSNQQKYCNDSGIDFLNLVLGIGKESDLFWTQIIQKQIWYDYQFFFDATQRFQLQCKGLLFIDLLQQCDINYPITPELVDSIFSTAFPLNDRGNFRFMAESHYYQLNTSRMAVNSKRRDVFRHLNNKDIIEQSIKWGMELLTINGQGNSNQVANLLVEQADLALLLGNDQFANQQCNQAISLYTPYHAGQLKAIQIIIKVYLNQQKLEEALQYFENALIILETHFGQSHPLYSTLYCILGYYFTEHGCYDDAMALYKSSLACCQRVLNEDHSQIAEIYTDLGMLCSKMGQYQQALSYYQKSIDIFQKTGQYCSMPYARTMLLMAQLYYNQEKYDNAQQSIQQGVDILEQYEYTQTDQLIDALKLQQSIYTQLNNTQKIEQIDIQLELLLMRHNMNQ